jgi:hypothetical protein
MSSERGSTGAQRLGTCAAKVLQCFDSAVPLRKHGRYAETPRSGDRNERMRPGADDAVAVRSGREEGAA